MKALAPGLDLDQGTGANLLKSMGVATRTSQTTRNAQSSGLWKK